MTETKTPKKKTNFVQGTYEALPHRGITQDTCEKMDYQIVTLRDKRKVEVACYWRDGMLVGQKIRTPDKKFYILRKTDNTELPLFGQHLWKEGGKRLVITTGEVDALAVSQMQDNRWPVVSVPHGDAGAADVIRRELDWVASFDKIILAFDMDEPAQKAVREVAELLPAGRVQIAQMPEKDADLTARKHGASKLRECMWNAPTFRPDGIIHVSEIKASKKRQKVWPWPWNSLTRCLMGMRSGEITMLTSGTGCGKSTVIREVVKYHLDEGRTCGMVMLEESTEETRHDLMSLHIGKPIRRIMAARELNEWFQSDDKDVMDFGILDDMDDEEYSKASEYISSKKLYLYDHRGSNLAEQLYARLEYMAVGLGCDIIVLDHLSVVVSMMDGGSERQEIDRLMSQLRSLVERTGVSLLLVTQLRKTEGTPYEEGGRITLHALRGSGSLASVPNSVIAIERNQQHPDPAYARLSTVRSLKGRFNGRTGICGVLDYDSDTGRLTEVSNYSVDESGCVVLNTVSQGSNDLFPDDGSNEFNE